MHSFVYVLLIFSVILSHFYAKTSTQKCFSVLSGPVGDVDADIGTVNILNNWKILPRIKSLLEKDFFHFYEVNLDRPCPFFGDDKRCSSKDCTVKGCSLEDIPLGLREHVEVSPHLKYTKEANENGSDEEIDCGLGKLDSSLSEERKNIIADWARHDAEDELTFCEPDDDRTGKMIYVDLLKNPERYTGYKGQSSIRIWYMIYNENCFKDEHSVFGSTAGTCFEKRAFYRMISGLHTSINVHLSYRFPRSLFTKSQLIGLDSDKSDSAWGPNLEEFRRRFDPELVPDSLNRIRNIYFTYLIELRALSKAAPYLLNQAYFTGDKQMDIETKNAVTDLLTIIQNEGNMFDESLLFSEKTPDSLLLKQQFREHFRNISRIMDCIGCQKCKLWGKLQTQGMGTALKILFSSQPKSNTVNKSTSDLRPNFQLRRSEIVALFNAFGRLSLSIGALQEFCNLSS